MSFQKQEKRHDQRLGFIDVLQHQKKNTAIAVPINRHRHGQHILYPSNNVVRQLTIHAEKKKQRLGNSIGNAIGKNMGTYCRYINVFFLTYTYYIHQLE